MVIRSLVATGRAASRLRESMLRAVVPRLMRACFKRAPSLWIDEVIANLPPQGLEPGRAAQLIGSFVPRLMRACFKRAPSLWIDEVIANLPPQGLEPGRAAQLILLASGSLGPRTATDELVAACENAVGGKMHYSQEGEDIVLLRMLGDKRNGFFVDVGAYHATRFSNTYALYRRGWRGVNIDATPGSAASFEALRPEDTNIESAVYDRPGRLTLHAFDESALNTFDAELAAHYVSLGCAPRGATEITARPLSAILDEYVPAGQSIDLLSIDVEGSELAVLRSNDWTRYAPEIVIVEVLDTQLTDLHCHPSIVFLADRGYLAVSRLTNSIILRRRSDACAAS
jgi:FkbM family methyltransferase